MNHVSSKTQNQLQHNPPDGGWGWMVLLGTAVTNTFNQAIPSLFSLLYGDVLEAMGHKTQGAAIVLSTMLFVTNFSGPLAGVLMKFTSIRSCAVLGSVFCTIGLFLSGFATNIWHLQLSYGGLFGCGLGMIQNSSFVAINSYFKTKKSRAVGLANVGTGVGQSVMPHLVRYLLEHYGFTGTCLFLSGLSLHGIAGTLLIQPVEWHMIKDNERLQKDDNRQYLYENFKDLSIEADAKTNFKDDLNNTLNMSKSTTNGGNKNNTMKVNKNKLQQLYNLFNISLLKNRRFVNTIMGIALAATSIHNFSMIYPLFLQKEVLLDKQQTATCMSAVAIADIVGRLAFPVLQDKFRVKAMRMLTLSIVWLVAVRQVLSYQTDLWMLIALSGLYGCGRSVVVVTRNIAITEHVSLEQVPAAVGLGMLALGVLVPPIGFVLGWLRDYTESYALCITAQNILLLIVLVAWLPSVLTQWKNERRNKEK